jgi:murein DD-endopeptidase MepM/ murein hydrolase activator NlpD
VVRVLGLCRVHNGALTVARTLDSLAAFCDDIYVIDDRSTDGTHEILSRHPAVTNVVSARSDLPATPWLIPESAGLELLYRMADFCRPDWVVLIDADQTIEADVDIRALLEQTPPDTAALLCPLFSTWSDPLYPDLIPVMGAAATLRGPLWRWRPGLRAGGKALHNPHWPLNIAEFGGIEQVDGLRIRHFGWSTLAERIAKVHHYFALDPDCGLNFGVAYDRSLLFGYSLAEIDLLKADYEHRVRGNFDVDARLPIGEQRFAIGRGYGPRAGAFHPGIDFVVDPDTPVLAVTSGTVCDIDQFGGGRLSVTIDHHDHQTIYIYLPGDESRPALGVRLGAGARIGVAGAEPASTDAYVHFEVRSGGRHTNPIRHLANMGPRPWPQPGRLRPVAGSYLPSTECAIAVPD